MPMIKIIECPRDAMQGLKTFIPTEVKAAYINQLLRVGFDSIDFGSFVSPKAIPQMKDTAKVLELLDLSNTESHLIAIVANRRGATDACQFEQIAYLGYPFSISETFQLRNTNATISESLHRVETIQNLCLQHNKQLNVYISMGFGNPYGDQWNVDIVYKWVSKLVDMGIRTFSLSDTIGVSNPDNISYIFTNLIPLFPDVEFGAHLHTPPHNWREKVAAAYLSGCRRFDSAIRGLGGCPMAKDDLTGNMATENVLDFFEDMNVDLELDKSLFTESMGRALSVFPAH
ncbi:MAG: hydroxymethylglutaryl-CoA lyase [Bacteroidota bacterium]